MSSVKQKPIGELACITSRPENVDRVPTKQLHKTLPPKRDEKEVGDDDFSVLGERRREKREMAQEKKVEEEIRGEDIGTSSAAAAAAAGFKFNVHAPEFVPRSVGQITPLSGGFYPYLHYIGGDDEGAAAAAMGSEWFYFGDQEPLHFLSDPHAQIVGVNSKGTNDVFQKIVKQVEYQFSDTNLVVSDFLMKIMNKDPEGYVPMSVIASWKKIKSLGANNYTLIKALRTSTKLIVSEDGKKVRRKHLFTERDKEELQSRTVVVENLPEDNSRQNLEKIFSVVGSVKNIRICHPQEPNASRSSKSDVLISNKLHALVEYESVDKAEKAVEKLNDERNWRKGLRVRLMLRRSPRSVIRSKRSEYDHFDMISEDDQSPPTQTLGSSPQIEQLLEQNADDNQTTGKRTWGRGRTKCHGAAQSYNGRGILPLSSQSSVLGQCDAALNRYTTPQGPRMPDGTRGFNMGRGKILAPILEGPLTTIGLRSIQL